MGKRNNFNLTDIYLNINGKKPELRTRENNPVFGKRNSKIRVSKMPYDTIIRVRYIGNDGVAIKVLDVKDGQHPKNHKHIFKRNTKKPKRVISSLSKNELNILNSIEKQNKRKSRSRRIRNGKNWDF